ncbi:MAG: hypothetical protein ABSF45_01760 [Terriglobia bacterium]|jgi:hypothetical protein
MSDVFTNRAGAISAAPRGKPKGKPLPGDIKTEHLATGTCNGTGSEPDRGQGAAGESTLQKAARIRLDVPMGTSYMKIQENIFRQAWQLAGTQLRAAIALGITPETVSRFLRRCDRARVNYPRVPEAWPAVAVNRAIGSSNHRASDGENQTPDQQASGDRVINAENQSPVAPTPFSENEKSGPSPTLVDQQGLNTDD